MILCEKEENIMNLCSIASGSSGNCIYVGNSNTNILVDVGLSCKKIEKSLSSIDVDASKLDGILVTHEHSDHISGLGVIARRYQVPIYTTVETINAILKTKSIGKIPEGLLRPIEADKEFNIKDITIEPFSMSHDAANPVCYNLYENGHKVSVATDLGKFDEYIISKLSNTEILLLEANHDVNMLEVGAYPYFLKQRILGDRGHLSNENSGKLICSLLSDRLKHIFLGHLSKENNYAELAYETVKIEIDKFCNNSIKDFTLEVANREEPSTFVSV